METIPLEPSGRPAAGRTPQKAESELAGGPSSANQPPADVRAAYCYHDMHFVVFSSVCSATRLSTLFFIPHPDISGTFPSLCTSLFRFRSQTCHRLKYRRKRHRRTSRCWPTAMRPLSPPSKPLPALLANTMLSLDLPRLIQLRCRESDRMS